MSYMFLIRKLSSFLLKAVLKALYHFLIAVPPKPPVALCSPVEERGELSASLMAGAL